MREILMVEAEPGLMLTAAEANKAASARRQHELWEKMKATLAFCAYVAFMWFVFLCLPLLLDHHK